MNNIYIIYIKFKQLRNHFTPAFKVIIRTEKDTFIQSPFTDLLLVNRLRLVTDLELCLPFRV